MSAPANYIPYTNIFHHLPINKGDTIYIASNIIKIISAARKAEGGGFDVNLFIDSIKNKIGNEGTLIFPAFNFELKQKDKFDISKTEPVTGLLPTEVFKRKDFKRTQNPFHSFMVWGKYANAFAAMNNKTSFGEDSPFASIHNKGAKILSIDLDFQHSNPFAHYAEEKEKVFYRTWKNYSVEYTDASGKTETREYKMFAKERGYVNNVNPLYEILKQQGAVQEIIINNVSYKIIDIDAAFTAAVKDIRENKARNICYFDGIRYLKSFFKYNPKN